MGEVFDNDEYETSDETNIRRQLSFMEHPSNVSRKIKNADPSPYVNALILVTFLFLLIPLYAFMAAIGVKVFRAVIS